MLSKAKEGRRSISHVAYRLMPTRRVELEVTISGLVLMDYKGGCMKAATMPGNNGSYSPVSISMHLGSNSRDEANWRFTLPIMNTPSELKEMNTGAVDWKTVTSWKFWIRKERKL